MSHLLVMTAPADIGKVTSLVSGYGIDLTANSLSYLVFVIGVSDTSMTAIAASRDHVFRSVNEYNNQVREKNPERQIAPTRFEILCVSSTQLQDIYVGVFTAIRRLRVVNGIIRKVVCDYTLGSANVILATVWAASCFTQDICTQSTSRQRSSLATYGTRTKAISDIYTSSPVRGIEVKPVSMLFITLHEEVETINLLIQEMHYALAMKRIDNLYSQVEFPYELREVKMKQWLLLLEALMYWDNFQFAEAVTKLSELIELRQNQIAGTWQNGQPNTLVDQRLDQLNQHLRILVDNRYLNILDAKRNASRYTTNYAKDLIKSVSSFSNPSPQDKQLMLDSYATIIHQTPGIKQDIEQRLNEYRAILHHNNMHGYEFIEEMVLNAERRARIGYYAEALVRLVTAMELLAAVRLLLVYSEFCEELNTIEKRDLRGRMFHNLPRDPHLSCDWSENDDGANLERYERYQLLRWCDANDELATIFFQNRSKISTLANKRNDFIHGYGVVTQQDYESIREIIVEMLRVTTPGYQLRANTDHFLIHLDFTSQDGIVYRPQSS